VIESRKFGLIKLEKEIIQRSKAETKAKSGDNNFLEEFLQLDLRVTIVHYFSHYRSSQKSNCLYEMIYKHGKRSPV